MGILGNNVNFTVGHYRTYLDTPAVRLGVEPGLPVLVDTGAAWQEFVWEDVQITGASFNYCDPHTDIIFRGEVAWFWDEPVFIPEINLKLSDTSIPLSPQLVQLISTLTGIDMAAIGMDAIPVNPTGGTIPRKDIFRWMLGFDKFLWIRPLNPKTTFMLSFQWFGQWVPDYDPRMAQPLSLYPDPMKFSSLKEVESTFTGMINTSYLNGMLTPQLALAYDARGVWLFQPSVGVLYEPFRFYVQYSGIAGNMTGFGAFRDRDQISFMFTYLLN